MARWAQEFIDPRAYVVDDTGFPKDGPDSPGVARMYSGSLGKVGNCQVGVSVHAVTDWASAAIDWRLFVPKPWDDTTVEHADDPEAAAEAVAEIRRRRARSKIPDQVRHREKWRQALEMLAEVTGDEQAGGWGLRQLPVVADAGYGDCTEFRLKLERRRLPYVLAVKASTSAYPADAEPVPSARGCGCGGTQSSARRSAMTAFASSATHRTSRMRCDPRASSRSIPGTALHHCGIRTRIGEA